MAVEVKPKLGKDDAVFDFAPPRPLFRTGVRPYLGYPSQPPSDYAVSRDGQRILVNRLVSEAPLTPISSTPMASIWPTVRCSSPQVTICSTASTTLSQEVRKASAVSFHDNRRAQPARKSM
jgi:hypothetical protein